MQLAEDDFAVGTAEVGLSLNYFEPEDEEVISRHELKGLTTIKAFMTWPWCSHLFAKKVI